MSVTSSGPLLGVTLKDEPATETELAQTAQLEQWLRAHKQYESPDEAALREDVIRRLTDLFQSWVAGVADRRGVTDSLQHGPQALIYTFGSYRLGVHGPGADIDTLCVGPQFCERDTDFFGTDPHCLQQLLYSMPEVDKDDFTPVPEAYVPVIKMKFAGISIDLLYARLSVNNLNPHTFDIKLLDTLRGVDEQTVRSLNGSRVTDTILKLVQESGTDVDQFRMALRFLKVWGKKAGIYSNVHGYLGGVNWAILVAKICQLCPCSPASRLVRQFFSLYRKWHWPTPLVLTEIREESLGLQVWNPKTDWFDAQHKMPIMTPCYPAMNSSANVLESSLEVMHAAFTRADDLASTSVSHTQMDWGALIPDFTFFSEYKNYMQVELSAANEKDLNAFHGHANARLRKFCEQLQRSLRIRLWPEEFRPPGGANLDGSRVETIYIGLAKRPAAISATQYTVNNSSSVNLTQPTKDFLDLLHNRFGRIQPGMQARAFHLKRALLPDYVFPGGHNPFAPHAHPAGVDGAASTVAPPSVPEASSEAAPGEAAHSSAPAPTPGAAADGALPSPDEKRRREDSSAGEGAETEGLPAAKSRKLLRGEPPSGGAPDTDVGVKQEAPPSTTYASVLAAPSDKAPPMAVAVKQEK